jgi:hypothetical protein
MDPRIELAHELATVYGLEPQVDSVALGGSLASAVADGLSDVDLHVHLGANLPLERRARTARRPCRPRRRSILRDLAKPPAKCFLRNGVPAQHESPSARPRQGQCTGAPGSARGVVELGGEETCHIAASGGVI